MTRAETSEASKHDGLRGRIDKRQSILEAAFWVFARDGYGQSCVREIAAEAGVAKPTIYNHLSDKETLFHEAMQAAAGRTVSQSLGALEQLRQPEGEVGPALEDVGFQLLRSHCSAESQALRWLLYGEGSRFPDLLQEMQREGTQRIHDTLADRLARLALSGWLNISDPDQASEQFLALLTGPMELRSSLGTRRVSDDELYSVASAATNTFLRAYALGEVGTQVDETSDR